MTLKKLLPILANCTAIELCFNGDAVATVKPGNAFDIAAYGDFIINDLTPVIIEGKVFIELNIKATPAKEN